MKKTMSRIIASVIAISANLCPLSANAASFSTAPESYSELTENYTKVDELNIFDWLAEKNTLYPQSYFSEIFVNDDGTEFVCLKPYRTVSVFTIAENISSTDIDNAISELYTGEYGDSLLGGKWIEEGASAKLYNFSMDTQKASEICDHLKEKGMITDCYISAELYSVFMMYGQGINYYDKTYCNIDSYGDGVFFNTYKADNENLLKEFTESKLEGYTLKETTIKNHEYIELIPPEGTDLTEQIKTAQKIYKETGLSSSYISPVIAPPIIEAPSSNKVIDVFNSVSGDANCDGRASVADSVTILQNIGNKDKYPLSAQGKFNADTNYDGITANDALAIQMLDAQGKL